MFQEIVPRKAYDIFENFFENRWTDFPGEEDFFRPIFDRRRLRPLTDVGSMLSPLGVGSMSPLRTWGSPNIGQTIGSLMNTPSTLFGRSMDS
jgi:hypothetical protein